MLILLLSLFLTLQAFVIPNNLKASRDRNLELEEQPESAVLSSLKVKYADYLKDHKDKSLAVLPLLSPLNLNASSTGYIINGTYCISNMGTVICIPTTLVIDSPNNRMLFDLGIFGGKYIAGTPNSYIFGLQQAPGQCFKVNGWNFSKQVAGWSTVASTFGSTQALSRYSGIAHDVGGCAHELAISIIQLLDFIIELNFAQDFPVNITGVGHFCLIATGIISYDLSTLNTWSNRDAYFALPTACTSPTVPDYCNFAFPPGNDCAIPQ